MSVEDRVEQDEESMPTGLFGEEAQEDGGQIPNVNADNENAPSPSSAPTKEKKAKQRIERKFPSLTFEEAIELAENIQKIAAGQKVRRSTLFEALDKSADSGTTRALITSSGQYGLTKGSYSAEYLELTSEGAAATSDDSTPASRLTARFKLAIAKVKAFEFLYEKFKGSKLPARDILADNLDEAEVPKEFREECVDTFIVNCKFLTLLRTIAGSERLIPIEQALDTLPSQAKEFRTNTDASGDTADYGVATPVTSAELGDFAHTCFYVTPIGDEASQARSHADFMMEFIVKPALKEFNLSIVRADQIGQPGMIGRQVVEHILKSRLVIADLSFHNPNVFYELCLRHVTRLPTVQIKRALDGLPFDLNQSRTISIETADVYKLYPKIQTYTAEIASQIRSALQDFESVDNPISLYYPKAKLVLE